MTYLNNMRCYLSGPIQYDNGPNWRNNVKSKLTVDFGLCIFDPHADEKQCWWDVLPKLIESKDYNGITNIASKFVRKDLCLVDRTDILIAYLPYKVPTTGTHHEIINSINAKKPTILICPEGKHLIPLWYYGFIPHDHMFGSWEDVYLFLDKVDNGDLIDNPRWSFIYGII